MSPGEATIVIASNRGPFSFAMRDGEPVVRRGAGGLVSAISSIARDYDILWISCALGKGDVDWIKHVGSGVQVVENMSIRLIIPKPAQYRQYYNVISNPLLWFVQHQLQDAPRFPMIDEAIWQAWSQGYAAINRQFAQAIAESIAGLPKPAIVMLQDYHLYLCPQYLRELLGDSIYIHFFSHIPWPGPDAWRVLPLPMRCELLNSLLQVDRIGFQTERDTRRFLQTCVQNLPDIRVVTPWRRVVYREHEVEAAPYPISVDVDDLQRRSKSREVREHVARINASVAGRKLILRVDRVEPSKNVLRGLIAYRDLLIAYPEFRGKVYFLTLLVPSRTEVEEYRDYLHDVTALASELNATLGDSDWEPVRILLGNNYSRALAALSLYDVLVVNPLADGMNLVAKEGVICNNRDGVLILSDEAGAAEELGQSALLVSPFDVYGTREAMRQALIMPEEERQIRARRLAAQVRANDIHDWFKRQITDIQATQLPVASHYGSTL